MDDTEIALLLMEGGAERAEGLRKLDEAYRARVAASLRARFPSMRPDDIADCYTDVLVQFIEVLRAYDKDPDNSTFDPNRPLLPYLLTVAYRRGVDRLRKVRLHDEFVQAVGRALAETDLGRYWSGLVLSERQEIQVEACRAIAQLPPKERLVWGVFVERFLQTGERPSDEELYELVCQQDGPEHTFVSVKRALNNGRAAVRRHLEARGFRDYGTYGDGS